MSVYFIGAGPGAADLITLRGANIIKKCPVCLYAGSLVPQDIIAHAGCESGEVPIIKDSAPLDLQQIMDMIMAYHQQGKNIARVHSGDPSIYGAIGEQIQILKQQNIPYEIVPGVSAYAAAAAELGQELTLPNISQSVILTRTSTRSSPMPDGEELANLAKHRATMAIHLSINNLAKVVRDLIPHYGVDCPVVVAYRIGWADSLYLHGTLDNIRDQVKKAGITRTALILVGHVLGNDSAMPSRLYDADHHHLFRA